MLLIDDSIKDAVEV